MFSLSSVLSCAVSSVLDVPELRMAVSGAVPSSLPVHRDVPHGAERQHVGPCVQHFPIQLPPTKGWTQQGKMIWQLAVSFLRHLIGLHSSVHFAIFESCLINTVELLFSTVPLSLLLSAFLSFWYQDFALSKSISLGQEKVLQFPPVWDWSQQYSLKDQALFNNPLYVGKSAPCVHNGTVRTFTHKRSKVRGLFSNYTFFII